MNGEAVKLALIAISVAILAKIIGNVGSKLYDLVILRLQHLAVIATTYMVPYGTSMLNARNAW